ncbi:MAG: tyrosine/phenylalanine carboxypeptidase domain-containing protein [Candidatus Diapherotrites archaeon]
MDGKAGNTGAFFETEKRLFEITDTLETDVLKFVEPLNSAAQMERFFEALGKGEEANPRFAYLPKNPIFSHFTMDPEYVRIRKELGAIKIEDSGIGRLLNKKKNESLARMELVRSIGSAEFAKKAEGFYGMPGKKTVELASETIESAGDESDNKTVSSEKAAAALSSELSEKGIAWTVILDENISPNAVVLSHSGLLKIRGGTFFSEMDVKRLALHEIRTHIFRHLNGQLQPFRLFIEGPGIGWLKTEEGLAVVNESIFGLLHAEQMKNYAGRVLAVDFAMKNSFLETFKFLCDFFPQEQAYRLAQRAKRGMNDTSMPGAFTKDYFYFEGALEVMDFLREGGELEKLYYGKISLADVPELEGIPRLVKPKFLPKYPKNILEKAKFP